MLKKIRWLKPKKNTLQFKLQEDCLLSEFFALFNISKAKRSQFLIHPEDNILRKQTLYTINTEIKKIQPTYPQEIEIVYEDDIVLIVNKPVNLLIHSDGNTEDTLCARVNYYLSKQSDFDALPIHRIDKDTSGLVFFCKHPFFQAFFDYQIQEHIIRKEYLAIVKGNFKYTKKTINAPISRDRHNAKKMIIHPNGKPAVSHIIKLSAKQNMSLLKIKIETGRKHQIRVHLASIGYPIINDELYGSIIDKRKLLLQSHQLCFIDPLTKKTIEVIAPMDDRFKPF